MSAIFSSVVGYNRRRFLLSHDTILVSGYLYQKRRRKKKATIGGKELTESLRCAIVAWDNMRVSAGSERGLARTLMASYYGEH